MMLRNGAAREALGTPISDSSSASDIVVSRDNRFRIRLYGDDCADVVQVDLDDALAGPLLFEETTGSVIQVRTDF